MRVLGRITVVCHLRVGAAFRNPGRVPMAIAATAARVVISVPVLLSNGKRATVFIEKAMGIPTVIKGRIGKNCEHSS